MFKLLGLLGLLFALGTFLTGALKMNIKLHKTLAFITVIFILGHAIYLIIR